MLENLHIAHSVLQNSYIKLIFNTTSYRYFIQPVLLLNPKSLKKNNTTLLAY